MATKGSEKRLKASACESGACGCVAGSGVGKGGMAAGVDAAIKDANLKHLRRIEGQVRGIAAMVEEDRYCADIITQVAAVRESLHSVARNLMRNHITHCAASALSGSDSVREEMVSELLDLVGKIAR